MWRKSTLQDNGHIHWEAIRRGDKQAYEAVFRSYYQSLCNYSCSLLKDMDEAEEAVQNVFYNLWKKRSELQILSVKAYLYRAVNNECLNKIKHAKVKLSYADDFRKVTAETDLGSDETMETKELNVKIHEALDALPEQCGLVFRMSRFENKKYAEIASELGISVKTVENHMGKALRILREQLKDYLPAIAWLFLIN